MTSIEILSLDPLSCAEWTIFLSPIGCDVLSRMRSMEEQQLRHPAVGDQLVPGVECLLPLIVCDVLSRMRSMEEQQLRHPAVGDQLVPGVECLLPQVRSDVLCPLLWTGEVWKNTA